MEEVLEAVSYSILKKSLGERTSENQIKVKSIPLSLAVMVQA
jgi:hypothetical protein